MPHEISNGHRPSVILRFSRWDMLTLIGWAAVLCAAGPSACGQSRHATSDNLKGYVHWIDLYDDQNAIINPVDNPRPYSPEKTCGRCHDFKTMSHGWHFNAASPTATANSGRPGQPLIWSDPRTGTYLPLSYRGWQGTFHPKEIGLSNWEVAAKMGAYLPGMAAEAFADVQAGAPQSELDRTKVTGPLLVDCLMCHARPGSGYSPFVWSEQIEEQNFAYAPTAALGLAVITGNMRRIKADADLQSDEVKEQLPKVVYQADKFRSDGKVFIDVMRKPASESCNYCHTSLSNEIADGSRWLHDDDVHTRAGIQCADCHRNGLDHETVRGFEGEVHPAGDIIASLSCSGCHLGESNGMTVESGRLGAPRPAHKGLPPLHFDKLSCTACHSGSQLSAQVDRQLTSISHHLGSHVKRTGDELPAVFSGVMLPVDGEGHPANADADDVRYQPQRLMWPSFWGVIRDGKAQPISPEQAYELVRKPLKIRRDFADDLGEVKLPLSQRKEILGDDDAARKKFEELTAEQQQKISAAEEAVRKAQVEERMVAALQAIAAAYPAEKAIYVSAGQAFSASSDGKLSVVEEAEIGGALQPYSWPMAHTVRPAQQALGVKGCVECHGKQSPFFFAELTPVASLPGQQVDKVIVHELQNADIQRLANWSDLFQGRSIFKFTGLIALGLTGLVLLTATVNGLRRVSSQR